MNEGSETYPLFEELLEQANNSLVQQAKADGKTAVGYTCYYVPEALLNCAGAFSVRLRAPNTGSLDISQYYMNSFICGYTRALFERAFEGGYNFLDFTPLPTPASRWCVSWRTSMSWG